MFKAIKEFFTGKPAEAPYKVETPAPAVQPVVETAQPVVEAKVDPVAVALDLEPLDLAATAQPAKKPRKPRAPKVAEAKPAAKKAAPAKKAAVKKPAARTAKSKTV